MIFLVRLFVYLNDVQNKEYYLFILGFCYLAIFYFCREKRKVFILVLQICICIFVLAFTLGLYFLYPKFGLIKPINVLLVFFELIYH